jgi:hypothetical protein
MQYLWIYAFLVVVPFVERVRPRRTVNWPPAPADIIVISLVAVFSILVGISMSPAAGP